MKNHQISAIIGFHRSHSLLLGHEDCTISEFHLIYESFIKKGISSDQVSSFPLRKIYTATVCLKKEVTGFCLFLKLSIICIIVVQQGIETWLAQVILFNTFKSPFFIHFLFILMLLLIKRLPKVKIEAICYRNLICDSKLHPFDCEIKILSCNEVKANEIFLINIDCDSAITCGKKHFILSFGGFWNI